jgi:outer membrane protein OmpA-like peptidoglycan-associated protein
LITAGMKQTLASRVEALKQHPELVVQIEGYTDPSGDAQHHGDLSFLRAHEVAEFFKQEGIPASRVISLARGDSMPQALRDDPERWGENRRVVIRIWARTP